jgi:uncharacterized membrane protein (UPF0127 family)
MLRSFEHITAGVSGLCLRPKFVRLEVSDSSIPTNCRNTIQARVARSFLSRCVGLLGSGPLPEDHGLLFTPGGSVHTWYMRFAIDVVFLDAELHVTKVMHALRPWAFGWAPAGTHYVLELRAGKAASIGLGVGARLRVTDP